MTKKNYIEAARIIRSNYGGSPPTDPEKERVMNTFIEFFRNDNPRFKEDVFRAACMD